MIALIRKELRSLKPLAILIAAVEMLAVAFTLCTSFPDSEPLKVDKALSSGDIIPIVLFGLIAGAGLLIRESDDGTLLFLDGLPVSRLRIFAAKMIAGFLVLSLVPLLDFGPDVLFGSMSKSSIDSPFPWAFVATFFALNFLTIAYVLSVATALSFLRKWFALAVGLIFLSFAWAQTRHAAWVEWLNPMTLHPGYADSTVHFPWRTIAWQSSLTAACVVVAGLGFQVLGARSRDGIDRAGNWLRFALMLGRLSTPVIWITALVLISRSSAPQASEASETANEPTFANLETKRYDFLFRESQRSFAAPLLRLADDVFDSVAGFFRAPKSTDRIVVDLASPMISHALGMTNWSKIRMRLASDGTEDEFRTVLGHETAHAVMHRLGGHAFVSESQSTRFFNEGMATEVEERFFESPATIQSRRRLTAAVISRGKVPFDLLCDDEALSKARDPELVYPLGSAFCRALIRVCGPESPGRILAEFDHPKHPLISHGASLWREIFQDCGYGLDSVTAAYDAEVASAETEQSAFVKTLPRIKATVGKDGNGIAIRPKYDGPSPGKLLICVDHQTVLGPDIRWHYADPDGAVRVPQSELAESTVRYMAGWSLKELSWPVFEPWVEAPIPR